MVVSFIPRVHDLHGAELRAMWLSTWHELCDIQRLRR